MKNYLVSTHYHDDCMNIDNMRSFIDPADAWKYRDSFGTDAAACIIEMSDNAPPKLLEEKDRNRA